MASGHDMDLATYKSQVSAVWRATLILSIITIVEVGLALWWLWVYDPQGTHGKFLLNLIFILASLGKAYFIIAEFMHVKYETRALTLTLIGPLLFLIWFIIAFLWEGAEWLNARQIWQNLVG